MTEADLREIETRYRAWREKDVRRVDLEICVEDITALIAEVQRLRRDVEHLVGFAPESVAETYRELRPFLTAATPAAAPGEGEG